MLPMGSNYVVYISHMFSSKNHGFIDIIIGTIRFIAVWFQNLSSNSLSANDAYMQNDTKVKMYQTSYSTIHI